MAYAIESVLYMHGKAKACCYSSKNRALVFIEMGASVTLVITEDQPQKS